MHLYLYIFVPIDVLAMGIFKTSVFLTGTLRCCTSIHQSGFLDFQCYTITNISLISISL